MDAVTLGTQFASRYELQEVLTIEMFKAIAEGRKEDARSCALKLGVPEDEVDDWADEKLPSE